jgi:hypothetical protein
MCFPILDNRQPKVYICRFKTIMIHSLESRAFEPQDYCTVYADAHLIGRKGSNCVARSVSPKPKHVSSLVLSQKQL